MFRFLFRFLSVTGSKPAADQGVATAVGVPSAASISSMRVTMKGSNCPVRRS